MAEQDLDRNHEATPHKLKEARKKGQVAKSTDLTSVIVYLVAVVYMYWNGWENIKQQFLMSGSLLANIGNIGSNSLISLSVNAFLLTLEITAPFFATISIAAILANLFQTGPLLTSHPIQPDFTRLNPLQGIKKVFSGKTLFDLCRNIFKLLFLTIVIYLSLRDSIPKFLRLPWLTPSGYVKALIEAISSLGLKVGLVLALIAIVDLIYTRKQFAKQMNMSDRELKDETKNREGDPRIRSRMRKLRMELRERSLSVTKTARADVLITNPQHLAIALRYEHGSMVSPQMIAKGAGSLAAVMRKIAIKNNIPIVQNRLLARALYKNVNFDEYVPVELYAEVAKIIVWVFALKQRKETVGTEN